MNDKNTIRCHHRKSIDDVRADDLWLMLDWNDEQFLLLCPNCKAMVKTHLTAELLRQMGASIDIASASPGFRRGE